MNLFGGKTPQELASLVYAKDPAMDPDLTWNALKQAPQQQASGMFFPANFDPSVVKAPTPGVDWGKLSQGLYGAVGAGQQYAYPTIPSPPHVLVGAAPEKPLRFTTPAPVQTALPPIGDVMMGKRNG